MSFWGGRLWTHYYVRPSTGQVRHEVAFHKELAKHYRGRILYQYPYKAEGNQFYFPDFILPDDKAILEVDDPTHEKADKAARDEAKAALFAADGFRLARCTNKEVDQDAEGAVLRMLAEVGLLEEKQNG